jgi:hypothetical protein
MGSWAAHRTSIRLRRAVAGGMVALLLGGCLSMRSAAVPGGPEDGAGVSLIVFADDTTRRAGYAGPAGLASELVRREGGRWQPVFRSIHPAWTVTGLPEGRYRVRFPARLDEIGNKVALDEETRTFRVREGQVTELEATLRHVSPPLVVAGVAAGVVAAVLLHEWLGKNDLPRPFRLPEPPWWLVDVAVHLVIDLALDSGRYDYQGYPEPWPEPGPGQGQPPGGMDGSAGPGTGRAPRGPGPVVSGHYPPHGGTLSEPPVRLVFSLAQPMAPGRVWRDGVTVEGERSGLIPGELVYDAREWWLVWRPTERLPRRDTLHVTLAPGAVEDTFGRILSGPVSFTFDVR